MENIVLDTEDNKSMFLPPKISKLPDKTGKSANIIKEDTKKE